MPAYDQITQYAKVPENTPPLDEKGTKDIQENVTSLLYYSRSVDPTMLPALIKISSIQAKPTLHTKLATDLPLDYAHTYHIAKIRYHTSNMILHVEFDAAYLLMP